MKENNQIQMLVLLAVCVAGCATWSGYGGYGGRTAQLTTYAANRSEAIMNTTREVERYCREHGGGSVRVVHEETVYQGQLDEQVGAALGSPTDYKTTVEFVCQ